MDIEQRFEDHWRDVAKAFALPPAISGPVLNDLLNRYGEPARHYHTARHIVAVLDQMAELDFADRDAARLAVIFHDVIYDPARQDNEHLSAALMRKTLADYIPASRLARAAAMIEATQTHKATGDPDTDLVLDLDMGILGQPWPVYDAYARGVMAEYVPVFGAEAYRAGRIALFIDPVLARGTIFLTPAFRHLDAPALDNLRREKAWLLEDGA